MRKLLLFVLTVLPWALRRRLLCRLLGHRIHPTARIGWAWIQVDRLVMGEGSRIGHLTVCKGLAELQLGVRASIGRANWITAYPPGAPRHFLHEPDRRPVLVLGEHAAITNRHLIDCTNAVEIGPYSTVAGFRSQLLTHSIDLRRGRQSSAPVHIGSYCFVGTACIVLGGSVLPDRCVLGAGSVLRNAFSDPEMLYAGAPARAVRAIDPAGQYFSRAVGFVD
jgi:acetyltransferase-like isoleucine patch superfamily enzyme